MTGELDLSTVARWEEDVRGGGSRLGRWCATSPGRVRGRAGVRTLFRFASDAASRGTRLLVVAPHDTAVRRLLDILAIESITPVCESRTEALRPPYRLSA